MPAGGILRVDILGNPGLPIGHVVMGFAVDHAFKRIIVVAIKNGLTDLLQAAVFIPRCNHGLTDGLDEMGIPLGSKAGASSPHILGQPVIAAQVLGDGDPPRILPGDGFVDGLKDAPTI